MGKKGEGEDEDEDEVVGEVEVEAAEVQILSEWNLSRRICLASAMRADSAVTGMMLILAKGAGSLEKSQLGLISLACNDTCESTTSGPAGVKSQRGHPLVE